MLQEPVFYKTSSPSGDLISFLAGVKKIYEDTGKKGVIYQRLNMQGYGYPGAVHPYTDESGFFVTMNKKAFEMLRPLLIYQEYIRDFIVWEGQEFLFDFDLVRRETFTNQPRGSLNRYFMYVFPQMACDLSLPWLDVGKREHSGKIIINFTERYRTPLIAYFFLKKYENDLVFAGLPHERDLFCSEWGLDVPLLEVQDFLELARHINNCKFFLGNQSMCFQIAEALKVPRILEIFELIPNVIPVGEGAHDFYNQRALEFIFEKLYNK